MANTPSAIKRVRQNARKRAINQPRRSAAKTLVNKAVVAATTGADNATETLIQAISALDRAAKVGAIHKNAADRRKSRLMRKVNAALGGEAVVGQARPTRATGKMAAARATKARVAASRATKAAGEQTAAGKARAAISRATRGETTPTAPAGGPTAAAGTQPSRTTGGRKAATGTPRTTRAAGNRQTAAPRDESASTASAPEETGESGPRGRLRGLLGRGGSDSASPDTGKKAAAAKKPSATARASGDAKKSSARKASG